MMLLMRKMIKIYKTEVLLVIMSLQIHLLDAYKYFYASSIFVYKRIEKITLYTRIVLDRSFYWRHLPNLNREKYTYFQEFSS